MTDHATWRPRHDDPLFIMAMDHRASFGKTLFEVKDDEPDDAQLTAMKFAKQLIFEGLIKAAPKLTSGRAGVLVDERYGQGVIDEVAASAAPVVLAVPVEASGHDWITVEWGDQWLEHVERLRPGYAKVLVRDNPDFNAGQRERQFDQLARISAEVKHVGVPLLYELLVPPTDAQISQAGNDARAYDRDIRPGLVTKVIADNQQRGVEPSLWKVEGLETVDAAQQVASQAKAGGRSADLIVLGRDAPPERLGHWLEVASQVPAFVGFAIGRSIWEDAVREYEASEHDHTAAGHAISRITQRYLDFVAQWTP